MTEYLLLTLFLIINYFHGVFSSGFIPILNKELGVDSALPFALYFFWIFAGQFLIYKYKILSLSKNNYAFYEILFSFSLIFMSVFNNKWGFNLGRAIEGLAAGLCTPVLFANMLNLKNAGTPEKRLVFFSSITALGFISGPFVITFLMNFMDFKACLLYFGIFFALMSFLILFIKQENNNVAQEEELSIKKIFSDKRWFDKFSALFLIKCFFGFFMAFLPSHLMFFYDKDTNINEVLLTFSVIFIIGQVITSNITKTFKVYYMSIYYPLIIGIGGLLFFITKNPYFLYLSAFFHSGLNFVAYINFNVKTTSAREFAFYNIITDPFMFIGALYANLGIYGVLPLILIYPIPFIKYLLESENKIRAEHFFPLMGAITIYKTFKKHKNPLKESYEELIIEKLKNNLITFDEYKNNHLIEKKEKINIVFTGDFCPSKIKYYFSEEVKNFLLEHELRLLNLEGPQASEKNIEGIFHDISTDLFETIISPTQEKPNFNILSCANNHILDIGNEAYLKTIEKYKNNNLNFIDSNLKIIEEKGFKIGIFSITFGHNTFWRKDKDFITLKPEDFLDIPKIQSKILNIIKEYKKQVDLLILSYHWGYESEYFPSEIQSKCFDIFKTNGLDILYGHHSHIVQPYEFDLEKNSLCLYSCGNLISPDDMNQEIYQKGIFYSIEIMKNNNKTFISKITPKFFKPQNQEIIFL
ncbi:MAG: MFS transporter [Candidatus Sericytochromatia bacterium]